MREGAVCPLVFEFAAQRVWAMRPGRPSPPVWLLMRRSLEATPEVKDYISNGDTETPLGVLASVAWSRFRVEEFFEDCKGYLYPGRRDGGPCRNRTCSNSLATSHCKNAMSQANCLIRCRGEGFGP